MWFVARESLMILFSSFFILGKAPFLLVSPSRDLENFSPFSWRQHVSRPEKRKEELFKQKTDQTRFPRTKRSRSRRIFESFSTNSLSISRSQFPLFRERGNKIKGEEECVIKGEEECVTQRTNEDGDAGNYATAAPTTPTTKWDDDNSDQWNECRYGSSVGTSVQRCDV